MNAAGFEDFLRRFLPIVQAVGTAAQGLPLPPPLLLAVEAATLASGLGEKLLAEEGTVTQFEWDQAFADFQDAEDQARAAIEQAPTPDP